MKYAFGNAENGCLYLNLDLAQNECVLFHKQKYLSKSRNYIIHSRTNIKKKMKNTHFR